MAKVTNLQASPLPQIPGPFDHLVRMPGQLLCRDAVVNQSLERAVQRFLFKQKVPWVTPSAERILVIQGQPGTGKTVAAVDASLRFGWAVIMLPVAMLASEHEGGASAALDDVMRSAAQLSRSSGFDVVVVMDDFDLGITGANPKTSNTVNSALLEQRIQALCDSGDYRGHQGCPIPLILTGNDFSTQRASLLRDGRATFVTHAPTLDDKRAIAQALFKPNTIQQRYALDWLVTRYRSQPIAFWRSIKCDLLDAHIDRVIANNAMSPDHPFAAHEQPETFDLAAIKAAARKRVSNRAKSFL